MIWLHSKDQSLNLIISVKTNENVCMTTLYSNKSYVCIFLLLYEKNSSGKRNKQEAKIKFQEIIQTL